MPLPSGGPWPPKPYDVALKQMETWDAWYVGDTQALTSTYNDGGQVMRPAQMAGGLVGLAARMFWGRPQSGGQSQTRLHMPVASDLCRTSAQLLFAEPPMFSAPDADEATKKLIDTVMNTPAAHSSLIESAEIGAALGGSYLRLVWDTDVADHVMREAVDADRAIPEFRWGQLTAVTFWSEVRPLQTNTDKVWRHLERHEPGRILHGLYEGTSDKLGMALPLQDHPDTEVFALLVDAESGIDTGVTGLTAAYVPNVSPNPAWRKTPGLRPLGRADFAPGGVISLMDFIDETWSSLARDVRLAKARLVIPQYMLTTLGPGKGAAFDLDQEVFAPVNRPPSEDGKGEISAHQFDIRVDEHLGTINAALREVLRAVGYSPLTMGLPDEVAATATEIHAREKDSLQTRNAKIRHYNAGLVPLSITQMELESKVFGTTITMPEGLELSWPDGARESLLVRAQSVQLLAAAQSASTQTRVKIMQPDLDGDALTTEVDLIKAENSMDVGGLPPLPTDDASVDDDVREKADALGVLIRAGVDPVEAANRVGLAGVRFTGAVPTSLRLPQSDATGLEEA